MNNLDRVSETSLKLLINLKIFLLYFDFFEKKIWNFEFFEKKILKFWKKFFEILNFLKKIFWNFEFFEKIFLKFWIFWKIFLKFWIFWKKQFFLPRGAFHPWLRHPYESSLNSFSIHRNQPAMADFARPAWCTAPGTLRSNRAKVNFGRKLTTFHSAVRTHVTAREELGFYLENRQLFYNF